MGLLSTDMKRTHRVEPTADGMSLYEDFLLTY